MNLLLYYRSQFIANCVKHESEWSEPLQIDKLMSHWHRERTRYHEFFRIMSRHGIDRFEYSITLPVQYFRAEVLVPASQRAVTDEWILLRNEQFVFMTYRLAAETMNGSVLRFLFKARSEAARMIDFSGGAVGKKHCAGVRLDGSSRTEHDERSPDEARVHHRQ